MQLNRKKIQFLLIIFLSLLVITLLVGRVFRYTSLAARLANTLEKELVRQFSAEVKIRGLGFSFVSPEIYGAELRTLEGRPLLAAEKIRISIDWISLLRHHSLVDSIRHIETTNSTLWISKDEQGELTFRSLFKGTNLPETGEKKEVPQLTIKLKNSTLKMDLNEEEWTWGDFSKIDGTVDLRSYPLIKGSATASSLIDPGAEARVEVKYSVLKQRGEFNIYAKKATAPLWGIKVFKLLGYDHEFKVEEGSLDGDLHFLIDAKRLKLDSTRLVFNDSRWKIARLPYPVENLDTDLTIAQSGIEFRSFKGEYNQSRISLKGRLMTDPASLDLDLYATSLNLVDWRSLFPGLEKWKVSGVADLSLKITGRLKDPRFQGEIRIDGGSLIIPEPQVNLDGLRILAKVSGKDLNFSYLEGNLDGAPFFLKGSVSEFTDPQLNLALKFNSFNPRKILPRSFPVQGGPVGGNLKITGRLSTLVINGELSAKTIEWNGESFQNIKMAGEYKWNNDYLRVNKLNLKVLESRTMASGEIINLTSTPLVRGKATVEGLNLKQIPRDLLETNKIPPLKGYANLKIDFQGPLLDLIGQGELEITDGAVDRFNYDHLQVYFSYNQERINSRAFLSENGGKAIFTGWFEPKTRKYQGDFLLRKMTFDSQLLPGDLMEVNGLFNGVLTLKGILGSSDSLTGRGWLEIHNLYYGDKYCGVLKLQGEANSGQIQLNDSFLITKAGQLKVTGEVNCGDKPAYDLQVNGDRILLKDIMAFLPKKLDLEADGLADLNLRVAGWKKPSIHGEILIDSLTFNDYDLGRGEVRLRWEEGNIFLEEVNFAQTASFFRGKGLIDQNQGLDIQVETKDFPLSSVKELLGRYIDNQEVLSKISGSFSGNGRLQGTLKAPVFEGNVSILEPKLAGYELDKVEGNLSWKDKVIIVDEMVLNRAEEEFKVYGTVMLNTANPYLDLGLKIEDASLAKIMMLIGSSPKVRIDGKVSGYLRVLGQFNEPILRLIAQFEEGEINGFTPLNGELDLQLKNSTITVNRLIVDDSEGELAATAVYTPGTEFKLAVNTKDFSIIPIFGLTGGQNLPNEGQVDLHLNLDTTVEGMKGEFSALIKDTIWGNFKFSPLRLAGQLQDDLLLLDGEELGPNRLYVQGTLPLNPEWFGSLQLPTTWPHHGSQIDLGIGAEKVEAISINPFFSKPIIKAGTIDGLISLNGNWDNPYLVGSMNIKGGRGIIPSVSEELREVNGQLYFSNRGVEIRGLNNKEGGYLEGRCGSGRFRLGGSILSKGIEPEEFRLHLKGDNLHLNQSFFDGLVTGEIDLIGPIENVVLRGQAVVKKARIGVPSSTGGTLPFDLNLDLNLQVANDVYFRMYGMAYVPFTGRLHVGGFLSKPELTGEFNSSRGWVNFMGDTFRIKHLKAEFRPDYKVFPYVELEASRFLAGAEVTLTTQGWSGEFENLVINPSSNPPMSKEEILKLLNWPEKINEFGVVTVGNLFQENINMVGDLFIGRFLDQFREIVPIDFLTLEQDREEGTFWMNMGKSLSEDLYLSYSRSLAPLEIEQLWTLEWRLAPNVSLLGDYSANDGLRWQLQYNLRF